MIKNKDIKDYFIDNSIELDELEELKEDGGIDKEVDEEVINLIYDYFYAFEEEDDGDDSEIERIYYLIYDLVDN